MATLHKGDNDEIIIIICPTVRGGEDVQWTDLAQNRDQWRTVENTGRNLPVP